MRTIQKSLIYPHRLGHAGSNLRICFQAVENILIHSVSSGLVQQAQMVANFRASVMNLKQIYDFFLTYLYDIFIYLTLHFKRKWKIIGESMVKNVVLFNFSTLSVLRYPFLSLITTKK